MQRRQFIATVASLSALGTCASAAGAGGRSVPDDIGDIGPALHETLLELLAWIASTPWQAYLTSLGVVLPPRGQAFRLTTLTKELTVAELGLVRSRAGFEDFGGTRLLQPGKPALSLLYFALASPRVRLPNGAPPEHYPDIAQLDELEDVIFAMQGVSHLHINRDQYVLAVFAYEFRPAAKTPHKQHADMVFSRTGVSRVGTRPQRWNRVLRCFDNVPPDLPGQPLSPQDVAATPARFGLFLAQVVPRSGVRVQFGARGDALLRFLLPVRKLLNGDPLLAGFSVGFSQYHKDEKLYRLTTMGGQSLKRLELPSGLPFDRRAPPFLRITSTSTRNRLAPLTNDNTTGTAQQLVALILLRSSVLVRSCPAPLVRDAIQRVGGRDERLRFKVPAFQAFLHKDLSNRRYTTLKMIENPAREAGGFGVDDILFDDRRPVTSFIAPRNGPTFVNIRYMVKEKDGSSPWHLGPGCGRDDWEKTIRRGRYWAAMFQDNLCDGCVSGELVPGPAGVPTNSFVRQLLVLERLPAFSLVAAPDFMQLVDGNDLYDFEDHFLEGGTKTVSGARVRANPHLRVPGTERQAFISPLNTSFSSQDKLARYTALTVTAIVCTDSVMPRNRQFTLDYKATNSLPDTASNVFAPGWDVTYSDVGQKDNANLFYFASFGLGSPFAEDMKLCAAANGMWPASSPDAARTFYPSLGEIITSVVQPRSRRPPTAVPLLDTEIGHHPASHAVLEGTAPARTGWDGEYGPFLTRLAGTAGNPGPLAVNFAEIGRADYVHNVLSKDRQMQVRSLQGLTAEQLIERMQALRTCVRSLPGAPGKVRLSKLWLVSAEAVRDWSAGAQASGIPAGLVGPNKQWAQVSHLGPGARDGYLFVFAADIVESLMPCAADPARAVVACGTVYVCQLARKPSSASFALAWVALQHHQVSAPGAASWQGRA